MQHHSRIAVIIIMMMKMIIIITIIISRCRLCKEYEETTDHLISGCPTLAKNEYIIRHDKVCTHLHYSICKK
jgi:hypothetical protein